MPLFRGTRPLKRWRYVGIFCEELMVCAAIVQVGPARQAFWAVLSRKDRRLRERTHTLGGRGAVELGPGLRHVREGAGIDPGRTHVRDGGKAIPGRLRVRDGSVALYFELAEDAGIEALCPHGRGYVWTRKQAGIPARGTVALDGGPPRVIEALAVVDDTAGYHARVTEWWWAAGVGVDPAGTPVAFNLVEGVNDPPAGSERAMWVAGEPREVAAVHFAPDLSRIDSAHGDIDDDAATHLRFTAEAQRSRRESLLLVRSDYRAPFGTFSGTLPGGVELAQGVGVVEHHRARW